MPRLRQIPLLGTRWGLGRPIQIILTILMVIIFSSILELDYVIVDLTLCYLATRIYFVGNTIRHQEAGEFPTLQDSAGHQTK